MSYASTLAGEQAYSKAMHSAVSSPSTPIDEMYRALARVDHLVTRVIDLSDRLCGPAPRACGSSEQDLPSGVIPTIGRRAEMLSMTLEDGMDALSRIERMLP